MRNGRFRRRSMFMAIVLFATSFPVVDALAKTTQEKLDEATQQQQETQQQIDATKDNLSTLQGTRNDLQKKLGGLNEQLNEVCANLERIEQQIDAKEDRIEQTRKELEEAKITELQQYESMKERIRFMYENGQTAYLEMLFSSKGLADFLNRSEYIARIESYDRRKLEEYQLTCRLIREQEEHLQAELAELQALMEQQQTEQAKVNELVAAVSDNIAEYSDQIAETEEQMRAYEEELKRQNSTVEALKAQLAEERRLAELSAATAWRDISELQFAEGDRYLLANLIYCEAGNQPFEGQVAVGAVVINRMMSRAFPNTMVEVIYAKRQFSPVASGRLALALAQNRATPSCYRAADEAMRGVTPVADCLFFRTPIDRITPRYRIAGHIFY